MTERGPRAELLEFPKIGHAPALMDPTQIVIYCRVLALVTGGSATNACAEQCESKKTAGADVSKEPTRRSKIDSSCWLTPETSAAVFDPIGVESNTLAETVRSDLLRVF
jgi:hypothetical protein